MYNKWNVYPKLRFRLSFIRVWLMNDEVECSIESSRGGIMNEWMNESKIKSIRMNCSVISSLIFLSFSLFSEFVVFSQASQKDARDQQMYPSPKRTEWIHDEQLISVKAQCPQHGRSWTASSAHSSAKKQTCRTMWKRCAASHHRRRDGQMRLRLCSRLLERISWMQRMPWRVGVGGRSRRIRGGLFWGRRGRTFLLI